MLFWVSLAVGGFAFFAFAHAIVELVSAFVGG